MRKVFLDDLPRWESGRNKGRINWGLCIGEKVMFIYNNIKGNIEIINYEECNRNYIIIKYKNENFNINLSMFRNCNLGKIIGEINGDFKLEIGQNLIDYNEDNSIKRNVIIIDKKKEKNECGKWLKYYKYKCNLCGFDGNRHWNIKDKKYKDEYWISEYSLLYGYNCPVCSNKTIARGINDIATTHPRLVKYFVHIEDAYTHTYGSKRDKILIKCPDCGFKKEMSINTLNNQGVSCSKCGDGKSYISKYMFNILEQLEINFENEIKFNWCKFFNPFKNKDTYGIYDFVIKYSDLIIETDGKFHRKDNKMNGQTVEESKYIDDEKDRLAQENGYKMIRISDEGDIKQNILDSDLNRLFDLSKINWLQCEEFACSNLVKIVCNYWNNVKNKSTTDLAEVFKIHYTTISNYLKQGHKLKWCNYNVKEEINKRYKKAWEKAQYIHKKPIKVFDKEMNLVYMFSSASESCSLSEKLFKTCFLPNGISRVCTGRSEFYKGYIFKFATTEEYKEWLKEQNKLLIHNENLGQAM